ncbi:MAG: AsmA family protein [Proteobacteria bacterium]|nr:AsmA family protein [Desulfobacula sp.]MBU3952301.1 AsmA family protein [Pseudomonadota bacterium]MBU4130634.1 AsmA family protein [Pseudomonadota bacterium]
MKGFIKWVVLGAGLLLVLIVGAIVLIPQFVDVQQYKPMIEELVSEQTGRSFSMGDDIKLSVFPWVGVSLSDLRLGNAKGFQAPDMVTVKRFEVRLRFVPLLSRELEVSTFVVDTPLVFLEKAKNGKANWENIGPVEQPMKDTAAGKEDPSQKGNTADPGAGKMPIESFFVENFSILNGLVSHVDQATGIKQQISEFNLKLTDISFDKPVGVTLSAKLDGKPLSLEGKAGPLGKEPGKQDIDLDMTFKALEQVSLHLKGKIRQPATDPKIALDLELSPFSPRKLMSELGQPFPLDTADPKVLDKVALKARVEGDAKAVSLSNGFLTLDDSGFTFLADIKAFDKPDIKFDMTLDAIDLDRYLPPKEEGEGGQTSDPQPSGKPSDQESAGAQAVVGKKTDYAPLRKLLLDGKIRVGILKIDNVKIQDFLARITAKNGVIDLDPVSLSLYNGSLVSKTRLDVRNTEPVTQVTLDANGIQAGPFLKDAIGKETIEGTLSAVMTLVLAGETPDMIKKSLKGKGELKFVDGAIVGIDIAGTVRNASSALGVGNKPSEKPRTDFAELNIPFSADKGIVTIPGASLISPLIRLGVGGDADLVKETLDFRVEPKFVATLKGQGDTTDRSGLLIPLLVTGSFDAPKIRPDLKAMIGGGVPDAESIKQILNTKGASTGDGESVEDKAKGLLKGFFSGTKE